MYEVIQNLYFNLTFFLGDVFVAFVVCIAFHHVMFMLKFQLIKLIEYFFFIKFWNVEFDVYDCLYIWLTINLVFREFKYIIIRNVDLNGTDWTMWGNLHELGFGKFMHSDFEFNVILK